MGEGAVNLPLQAAEAPRRLMTKGDYARYRSWKSPSQVSNLIRAGKLKAPALRPDGLIDVDYADAMLARQLDPAKMRTPAPAGPALAVPQAAGDLEAVISGRETYPEAKRRKELAAAELAEMDLARRRGELVETAAVQRLAGDVAMLWRSALEQGAADLARKVRGVVVHDDLVAVITAHGRGLQARVADEAMALLSRLQAASAE